MGQPGRRSERNRQRTRIEKENTLDRQEYIENILDHFEQPRHKHRMENPSVQLGGGNPGCGDLITIYLRIGDDDRIEEVSFEGDGCTISQAGGSMISEIIEGMTLDEVTNLGKDTMIEEMGEETVKSRVRCATLALGTAQAAVKSYRDEQRLGKPSGPETFEN